jgi:hypothetical protein
MPARTWQVLAALSALDEDLERRLLNWARWKLAGGELSRSLIERASSDAGVFGNGDRGSGYRETTMPILSGEALETDTAVNAVESAQRDTIRGWYLGILPDYSRMAIPWTQADLARRMGYALRTFERMLTDARRAVAEALAARRNGRRAASARR